MSLQALSDFNFTSKFAKYLPEHKRREVYQEAVERVKVMHLRKYPMVRDEIEQAFNLVHGKRVLPSMRSMQFGGSPIEQKNARIYNCLEESTEFITSEGVKSFRDFRDGDTVSVLTHKGRWRHAVVRSYGRQVLHNITITRGGNVCNIAATENHRWILSNGEETDSLKVGDALAFCPDLFSRFDYDSATPDERLYWAYGFVYGDGTTLKDSHGKYTYSMVRLCGAKSQFLSRFLELGFGHSYPPSCNDDPMVYTGKYLKTTPDPSTTSPRLIRAFVRGYLDADGEKNRNRDSPNRFLTIQVTGEDSAMFIRKCFPVAGMFIVSESAVEGGSTNLGDRGGATIRFRITNCVRGACAKPRVSCITPGRTDTVWCLEVEDDQSFVLPNGLVTGNCTSSYCDRPRFFQEAFWLLLCGSGVGFSVQKQHIGRLPDFYDFLKYSGTDLWSGGQMKFTKGKRVFVVPDTIEGWADALGILIATYLPHPEYRDWEGYEAVFDYSQVRPEGSPISHGGKAPGPEPLRVAIELIRELLDRCIREGQTSLRPIDAYDIVMHASDAVLAGGVRRSATICLFSVDDMEMATAKTPGSMRDNPQRGRSNNSAVLIRGETTWEQFKALFDLARRQFGEPGFYWTDSEGVVPNPCVEIGLWPVCIKTGESGWSFCNLCEINGRLIKTPEDFYEACAAAATIGTLQAGYTKFAYLGPITERIVRREALLGVSITGIMDNPDILLDPEVQNQGAWVTKEVNRLIAEKIGINPAARITCVKPAGTTSCILKTASGIHPHHSKRYFRRVQGNRSDPVLQHFKNTNPTAVEPSTWSKNGTDDVLTFLIEAPEGAATKQDKSALNLLADVRSTQQNWVMEGMNKDLCVDPALVHNVSNTINVKDGEWDDAAKYIYDNRQYFSGVSLIADTGDLDYPQAPMMAVYDTEEIEQRYGVEVGRGYSLVLDGVDAFGDLWSAASCVLGYGERLDRDLADKNAALARKVDWCDRLKSFSDTFFGGDIRRSTYFVKHIWIWEEWKRLSGVYQEVDYTTLVEDDDNTSHTLEAACAGGACEIIR